MTDPLRRAATSRRRLIVVLALVGVLVAAGLILRAVNGPSSADISSMNCSELRSYQRTKVEPHLMSGTFEEKQKAAQDAQRVNTRADRLGCADF